MNSLHLLNNVDLTSILCRTCLFQSTIQCVTIPFCFFLPCFCSYTVIAQVSATTGIYEVIGRGQEYVIKTEENSNAEATHHEIITSVGCRCYKQPNSKTSSPGADTTGLIVVVGYDSGYVRFFTEGGRMLVAQMLHHGPVKSIRGQPSNAVEDVAVLYEKVVVLMDGFSLVQTIRACVARLAHGFDLSDTDCPPLTLKKWGLDAQSKSSDIACFGAAIPTAFENLVAHTSVAAPINRYIVSGKSPMLALYSTAGCDQKRFSAKVSEEHDSYKMSLLLRSTYTEQPLQTCFLDVNSWYGIKIVLGRYCAISRILDIVSILMLQPVVTVARTGSRVQRRHKAWDRHAVGGVFVVG